jgi:hypothetical protein
MRKLSKIENPYSKEIKNRIVKKVEKKTFLKYDVNSNEAEGTIGFIHKKKSSIRYTLYQNGYVRRKITKNYRNKFGKITRKTIKYQLNPVTVKKKPITYLDCNGNIKNRVSVKRIPVNYEEGSKIIIRLSNKFGW